MEWTLKQIADELGISKQKVYRYVKEHHINEARQSGQTKWYDDTAQAQIKAHFLTTTASAEPHHEAHQDSVYDALLKQLEIKDSQIAELQRLLDQEQKLHAMAQAKIELLESHEDEQPKRKWWQKK